MSLKYVIVEQINYGRSWRAKPGLSFVTYDEGEAWIFAKVSEKYRYRFRVESRAVKDVDASQTMHCQCCGRAIHAALGSIAHHGYQRPGYGWQTRSCFGAKRLPWEADRGALADLIDHLKSTLLRCTNARAAVADEIEPVTHGYYGPYDRNTGRSPWLEIEFMRDTFEAAQEETPVAFARLYGSEKSFDHLKTKDLANRDRQLKQLKDDLKEMAARYNGWTQTHQWNGKLWEAL